MAVMGFAHDPGPFPFVTIRDAKWANRLHGHSLVEIRGEHGCSLKPQWALVTSVEPYSGPVPAHLASLYAGRALVAVGLTELTKPPAGVSFAPIEPSR